MEAANIPEGLDQEFLRDEIKKEYRAVAKDPDKGFHFHTGRRLARIVEYKDEWLDGIPESVVGSFAGTGNPFSIQLLQAGEKVVDLGCGAGIDSFIAANQVGASGAVVGIDMTEEMLDKARQARDEANLPQLRFELGYLEQLPLADGWADVVISNGVVNLCPNKAGAYAEIFRVLKPGGRIQIGDIMVHREVPESAKQKIDLWTG